jgi:hypothetical protein
MISRSTLEVADAVRACVTGCVAVSGRDASIDQVHAHHDGDHGELGAKVAKLAVLLQDTCIVRQWFTM